MILYLDLDGVLADFDTFVEGVLDNDWKEEIKKPNWGKISEYQNIYSLLNPMPDAYELFCFAVDNFDDVQILTALPRRAYFPDAVNHKRDWVHKHFDPDMRVNFGPYAYDKQFHCRPGDILVDDSELNIPQWISRGGSGILHTSAKTSIEQLKKILG